MIALIDGDIIRYEIGFAAETGWKAITDREEVPPFDYVKDLLEQRIASILSVTGATDYCLYITEGRTFRFDIAKTKPYKGTRKDKKPAHFDNLTAYIKGVLPCRVCTELEADDWMAIDGSNSGTSVEGIDGTIICSRDKDLRQVPGRCYSWELGKQPAYGPVTVTDPGTLELSGSRKTLKGSGFVFFCGQLLTGDTVDNVPGAAGVGAVSAYEILSPILEMEHTDHVEESLMAAVESVYEETYGKQDWEEKLIEQGQLLWIVRRLNEDGSPQIWKRGLYA